MPMSPNLERITHQPGRSTAWPQYGMDVLRDSERAVGDALDELALSSQHFDPVHIALELRDATLEVVDVGPGSIERGLDHPFLEADVRKRSGQNA
jgi:hypothetical protein